jgi:hypothetical protein
LLDNHTQLSLIIFQVAQSNNTISQSVEEAGQITSQLQPQLIASATAFADG